MLRSLLLLLGLALVLPTVAAADDTLVRGAFGSGTLLASSTRAPAPPCATPPSTPEAVLAQCAPIGAAAFGTCTNAGRDQLCNIAVTAQPRAGWVFRRWAPQSNRCAGATNPVCTFRTREVDCDATGERCTVNEPGPFRLIAEFADRRAPTVELTGGPRAGETVFDDAGRVAFAFTTDENDEAPTFRCQLDAGPATACASPHALTGVADGLHRFCVTATDASGRPSEAPACRAWRQETPPAVELLARPPVATAATAAAFTYRSNKAGHADDGATSSFECQVDGGAFEACEDEGLRLEGLADGPHRFAVRTRFRAAGVERFSAAATHAWSVDTAAPQTTITSGPPDGATIVDVAPTFTFGADEPAAFTCAVDGGAPLPCASPFTTPPLSAGPHTVAIAATDAVGNADPSPATVAFTLVTGLATLLDADGDGVPEALDCDDRDADVRPGALERAGNGSDENCDGVLAPFPRVTSVISVSGSATAKTTRFTRLLVTGVPAGGKVELRCSGPCPFKRRSLPVKKGRANGARRTLSFRAGATVEVRVTAPEAIGKVRRLRIVKRKFPRGQDLCLSPTSSVPRRCADNR